MTTAVPARTTGAAPEASRHRLDAMFSPASVAICGVTSTPGTVPYDIFHNILTSGYRGTLYPIAPGKRNICAVRAHRYVIDIEGPVDMAGIVFPANVVERSLVQCAEKGIRAVIVISAGFREVGAEGARREQRLKDLCAAHDMALIGPNCLGLINTDPAVSLNASFARRMPDVGRIAFLSQSGALCTAVLDYARDKGIGFSKFVSFGNKAGVTEIELLDYLHEDPHTDVILMYLEEVTDGRGLMAAARRVTRGDNAKPILALKSGRTPQGAHAAASHTGSLAGEDAVCDALLREAGIIRVDDIEQLFHAATLYTGQPEPAGDRLAIVTNAGGPGVMATDAAIGCGLTVTRFEPATTQRLRAALPAAANVQNPVDVIGDARADRYDAALEAVLEDPNVDQVLVILTPQSMTDIEAIADGIRRVRTTASKPIACSFMGAADVAAGIRMLRDAGIPHYALPEVACRAMADVRQIGRWRRLPIAAPADRQARRADAAAVIDPAPEGYLREDQALAVLAAYDLPVPGHRLCRDPQEAVAAAARIGFPVTLRIVSRQIVHKSEVQGVVLDLPDADAVRRACAALLDRVRACRPDAAIDGVLVRAMIPAGHEFILGAKRDAAFGPTLMFGLGGIYVELFRDVSFAAAPLDRHGAARLIRRVRAFRLLEGARGAQAADVPAIERCVIQLGRLASDFDRITELDINPLIVGPAATGNAVADVRIRLGPPATG